MKQKISNINTIFRYSDIVCVVTYMFFLMTACGEDFIGQQPVDKVPPGAVTNVQTEALPGGAKITYDLPNETDISYVICEYNFKDKKRIARSSVYSNYIMVEGLGEIAPCQFTLYLVDHSENKSAPYTGSFIPLEPPYQIIFKTITMEPDFGGVVIRWENENNDLVGAFLYAMNDQGEWEEKDLVFSSSKDEKRSIRGYNTSERKFGVSLIDRFDLATYCSMKTKTFPHWCDSKMHYPMVLHHQALHSNNRSNRLKRKVQMKISIFVKISVYVS